MSGWRLVWLLLGLGLFAGLLYQSDLAALTDRVLSLGLMGGLLVVTVYLTGFVTDTATWQLMIPSASLTPAWLYRLWQLRMVGEALNLIIPAGSLGGEPVKAYLLKQRCKIGYREGAASLVMAKTVILLALIGFSAVGFFLMTRNPAIPASYVSVAGAGLAALTLGVGGFFVVQRWRLASHLAAWLSRRDYGGKLSRFLEDINAVDNFFVAFYAGQPQRFAAGLVFAFGAWLIGTVELYVIFTFLDHPIDFADAVILETVVQLVRAGSFFIPANLGATEAGLLFLSEALYGVGSLGLAASLVRRGRDILWIACGLVLGWRLALLPNRLPRPNS